MPEPKMSLGVWLDDPPSIVLRTAYAETLQDLGVDHLVVMVDGPNPGLSDLRWDVGDLERLRELVHGDIAVIPSLWPAPFVEIPPGRLEAILAALRTDHLELDCEPAGGWTPILGLPAFTRASQALADALLDARVVHLDVTTFPAAVQHAGPLLSHFADARLVLQLYAVTQRNGRPVTFDSPLGPERWTARGVRIARRTWSGRIALGMAAYRSAFRGHTEADAWQTQLATYRQLGDPLLEPIVRVWSSKWLVRLKGHQRRRAQLALAHQSNGSPSQR